MLTYELAPVLFSLIVASCILVAGTMTVVKNTQLLYLLVYVGLAYNAYSGLIININQAFVWSVIFLITILLEYRAKISADVAFILFLATLAAVLLFSAKDIIAVYILIELLSLSTYLLVASTRSNQLAVEASLKYFILGALASGILVLAFAIIYGETGLIQLDQLAIYNTHSDAYQIGGILLLVALLFKLGAAPFHAWTPDVYHGSPQWVLNWIATVPKLAIVTLIVEFMAIGVLPVQSWLINLAIILSMLVGTIGGLNQGIIKRLIAYSSISHASFFLLGSTHLESVLVYIVIYALAIYILLTIIPVKDVYLFQLIGKGHQNGIVGFALVIALLSIAGIPPLYGFFTKFDILSVAIANGQLPIVIITLVASAISAFYYVRIIMMMYFVKNNSWRYQVLVSSLESSPAISYPNAFAVGLAVWLTLTLVIEPSLLELILV